MYNLALFINHNQEGGVVFPIPRRGVDHDPLGPQRREYGQPLPGPHLTYL